MLAGVLQEGVHQLGVYQVPGLQLIEDVMATVVGHATQDGETGDQHRVVVVPEGPVLDEADETVEAPEGDQLAADGWVGAKPVKMKRVRGETRQGRHQPNVSLI